MGHDPRLRWAVRRRHKTARCTLSSRCHVSCPMMRCVTPASDVRLTLSALGSPPHHKARYSLSKSAPFSSVLVFAATSVMRGLSTHAATYGRHSSWLACTHILPKCYLVRLVLADLRRVVCPQCRSVLGAAQYAAEQDWCYLWADDRCTHYHPMPRVRAHATVQGFTLAHWQLPPQLVLAVIRHVSAGSLPFP